jgi:D-3-phosphoglycerate dehydrogenase
MTSVDPKILVAEPYGPEAIACLQRAGRVVELDACDADALAAAVPDAQALLVRTYARVTRELLDEAKRLRVIGRAGVGLDNIDLEAARDHNVIVVHTPAAATHSVAELTVGLMVGLERRLMQADRAVREGQFREARQRATSRELRGLTLGIIGMGRIGTCVGRITALGFGMRVIYNDILDVGPFDFPTDAVGKPELMQTADVISLHVPLTPLTRGLVDGSVLATMKTSATLINTARGRVVDLDALAAALSDGALAGAALDVYAPEPPPPAHPILHAPNVLLSSHIGARTSAGIARMERVVEDVVAVLAGRPPTYPASPDG